jgi:hypothetical protein
MNSERTQAYGRVVRTLDELGPAKLLPAEQERLREVADTLLFSESLDSDVLAAIDKVEALAGHLVDSGRWTPERADELRDDVLGCGPVAPVA